MIQLTRRAVLSQAWPIVIGQALIPCVGLVDTAVIGRTNDGATLGGVALGVTTINLALWSFGFLRMSVTGLTAQAAGAGDQDEVRHLLLRGLFLDLALGPAF